MIVDHALRLAAAYQRALSNNDCRLLAAVLAHEQVHLAKGGGGEVEAWAKTADVLERLKAPSWVVDYARGCSEQAVIDADR